MKIKQTDLIEDLILRTNEIIIQAEAFKQLPTKQVNWKPHPEKWSVLECMEHLNLYGDFYLDEIENRIRKANHGSSEFFKSGWFGNYFAKSMLPKNGKIRKMKTFRDKDPTNSDLSLNTIDRFLLQQHRVIELLNRAQYVNMNKVKTSITIPIVKLRLGDSFRVVIYHNQRHMLQAKKGNQSLSY